MNLPVLIFFFLCGFISTSEKSMAGAQAVEAIKEFNIQDLGAVYIDGMRYRKFSSGEYSIFVPNFWNLSEKDFDQAFCASKSHGGIEKDRVVIQAEAIANQDVSLYAKVIQRAIHEKCDGANSDKMAAFDQNLDIGVAVSGKKKD